MQISFFLPISGNLHICDTINNKKYANDWFKVDLLVKFISFKVKLILKIHVVMIN